MECTSLRTRSRCIPIESCMSSNLLINLLRLRTACGFTQVEMADRAGLSRMGYRKLEAGESSPKPETLDALAHALDATVAELIAPASRLKSVRFRAQKKLNSREEVLARISNQLDQYVELEQLLNERKSTTLHKALRDVSTLRGPQRAVAAAQQARVAFGLKADDSIRDICGLLEDNGVKVLTPSLATDGFFGLSIGVQDHGPAIAVNTWERISVERWIFTAAHELGHLLLHSDAYEVDKTDEDEGEEKEADTFAGHFLMPVPVFKREFREAGGLSWYDRVFKLKRIFRVSYRTVLHRIASEMPVEQRRTVWIRFNVEYKRNNGGRSLPGTVEPEGLPPDVFFRRPADKGSEEPERLNRHDFVRDRLARLVRRALKKNLITVERAAEILERDQADMRELARSWDETADSEL
ncbi:ImmA/IrrE family metallo-endopeptidase [bacterium]|nr:MAG: ImmA/IrrE family metallo-endopeptidase [bacterium]